MSITVYIAFAGWVAASLWLVSNYGAMRGLPAALVGGFLFLPPASMKLVDGVPPLDRELVIAISALVAVMAFDPSALRRYRYHWLDAFPIAGAAAWASTNLLNGVGFSQLLLDLWWYAMFALIPYFLARCVLTGSAGLQATAIAIVAGTLILLPLVLYEVRMSPILNYRIYGFGTGNEMERFRFDGWRPRVFQPAGLGLAVWLAGAAVVAWALHLGAQSGRILRLTPRLAAWGCLILGFLSRGAGAIALMVVGLAALFAAKRFDARRIALAMPLFCGVYIGTALIDSAIPIRPTLLSASSIVFGNERAASLETRFRNEEILVARALQKPVLGWGGWGDYRQAYDLAIDAGMTRILTDGLWVITLGKRGLVGLLATWGWFVLPAALAVWHAARIGLARGRFMLVLGLAMFCWIFALDLLFNAFASPVQALVAGTLTTFVAKVGRLPDGAARRTAIAVTRRVPKRDGAIPAPTVAAPLR